MLLDSETFQFIVGGLTIGTVAVIGWLNKKIEDNHEEFSEYKSDCKLSLSDYKREALDQFAPKGDIPALYEEIRRNTTKTENGFTNVDGKLSKLSEGMNRIEVLVASGKNG